MYGKNVQFKARPKMCGAIFLWIDKTSLIIKVCVIVSIVGCRLLLFCDRPGNANSWKLQIQSWDYQQNVVQEESYYSK